MSDQYQLFEKYKDSTYDDLLKTVKFDRDQKWCHPSTEDIFGEFGLYTNYETDYEVKFLTERDSDLSWICTDTGVGLSFIYYIEDDGSETVVGIKEQDARKSDPYYRFISVEWMEKIREKLIDMIRYSDIKPPLFSLSDQVIKDPT